MTKTQKQFAFVGAFLLPAALAVGFINNVGVATIIVACLAAGAYFLGKKLWADNYVWISTVGLLVLLAALKLLS